MIQARDLQGYHRESGSKRIAPSTHLNLLAFRVFLLPFMKSTPEFHFELAFSFASAKI